ECSHHYCPIRNMSDYHSLGRGAATGQPLQSPPLSPHTPPSGWYNFCSGQHLTGGRPTPPNYGVAAKGDGQARPRRKTSERNGVMRVLVMNCGSSTLKFELIDTAATPAGAEAERRLAHGVIERIGGQAHLNFAAQSQVHQATVSLIDHEQASRQVL